MRHIRKERGFMDIALFFHRKRTRSCFLFLALFLMLTLFLSGCDPFAGKYPCDSDATWVCHDPEIVLEYTYVGWQLYCDEVIEYNGEELPISIWYGRPAVTIYPYGSNYYRDRLITGRWKYVGENLVIEISEDYLFGWRYTELVFERVE